MTHVLCEVSLADSTHCTLSYMGVLQVLDKIPYISSLCTGNRSRVDNPPKPNGVEGLHASLRRRGIQSLETDNSEKKDSMFGKVGDKQTSRAHLLSSPFVH